MSHRIQLRRDTASNWSSVNPVLAQGEPGWEIGTNNYKIGDGITAWNSLPYIDFSGSTYIHEQSTAAKIWSVTHNLNKRPSVTVVDSAGTVVTSYVNYIDDNTCTIEMNAPFVGRAYLN